MDLPGSVEVHWATQVFVRLDISIVRTLLIRRVHINEETYCYPRDKALGDIFPQEILNTMGVSRCAKGSRQNMPDKSIRTILKIRLYVTRFQLAGGFSSVNNSSSVRSAFPTKSVRFLNENTLVTDKMTKSKEIDIQLRDRVIENWKERGKSKLSLGKIAKKLNLPKSTVQYIVTKYRKSGRLENEPRSGRPPALTLREKRRIMQEVRADPFVSAPELKKNLIQKSNKTVSTKTITRTLKSNGIVARRPRKIPFISKVNQRKRLEFARKYVNQPKSFWESVLWSDETKINLFGSDGHKMVYRKNGEALSPKNLLPTVKHGGGSVMVWSCFTAAGVGNIEFIDVKMDSVYYKGKMERNIKDSANKLGLGRRFLFQQDNDPKHTSKIARDYLKQARIATLEWVAQSPDVNPIEHLWDHLKRELRKTKVSNKNELKDLIVSIWQSIPIDVTQKLVDSMSRRLEAVIAARGGPTKY